MTTLRLNSNFVLVRGGMLDETIAGTGLIRPEKSRTNTTVCRIEAVGPKCKLVTPEDIGGWCQVKDFPANDVFVNPLDKGQWLARETKIDPPCVYWPEE